MSSPDTVRDYSHALFKYIRMYILYYNQGQIVFENVQKPEITTIKPTEQVFPLSVLKKGKMQICRMNFSNPCD